MKIAGISCAFNEHSMLKAFENHVKEYRDRLTWHIVVDNGSDPSYKSALRAVFPTSIIIERSSNGGTTAAFNAGIRYALNEGAEAILLITQDIRLPAPSLEAMIKILQLRPEIGIVGPLLLCADGKTVEEYGGKIDPKTLAVTKLYAGHSLDDSFPDELIVDFIAGGVNLTRREVFEQIGLQDESLFMYGDEVDFDIRARKAGWKLLVTRKAIAFHEHQGDSSSFRPQSVYLMARNQLWLVKKHRGQRMLLAASLSKILGLPHRIGYYLKRRRPDLVWAYIRGIAHGIIGKQGS
jgi:GT2 family glycosyltransferase